MAGLRRGSRALWCNINTTCCNIIRLDPEKVFYPSLDQDESDRARAVGPESGINRDGRGTGASARITVHGTDAHGPRDLLPSPLIRT
jgi:hypothetical protein